MEGAISKEENPFLKSRYTFYCAQSYRDCGEYKKAIEKYSLRAKLGGWFQEIYISYLNEGRLKIITGECEESTAKSFLNGIDIDPYRAECYYEISRLYRNNKKYNLSYLFSSKGLECKVDKSNLFLEPESYGWKLKDEYSLACYYTSRFNESRDIMNQLMYEAPECEKDRIKNNLSFFPINHS